MSARLGTIAFVAGLVGLSVASFAQVSRSGQVSKPGMPRSGVIAPAHGAIDPDMRVEPPRNAGRMPIVHPRIAPRAAPGHPPGMAATAPR